MVNQFKLPDVGEGLTEAEIIGWRVAVGDHVELNQILVEVETAKAVVELPSPYTGTVLQLLHTAGDVVPVGSPIITIGDPAAIAAPAGDDQSDPQPVPEMSQVSAPDASAEGSAAAVLVGYGVRAAGAVARRPRKIPIPRAGTHAPTDRPTASPPVRKLARGLSVDLATVTPTGHRGQVTRNDVLAVAAQRTPVTAAGTPAQVRIPVKGARKHIADAMVRSAFTAPHVTEWLSVDITRTLRLIADLRSAPSTRDLRITPLTLLARAAILTLGRHHEINASWDDSAQEIVQHHDVNLGIAVASPRGLIVPNIPAAQNLDFADLSRALAELINEARANRTALERMRSGTFTITNVGVFGVDGATPILNPGEAAILALGQTRQLPWNHKGRVRLRSVTTLSLSFDHRLVDGELGSKVLAEIGELLEHPARALAR
ncbi:dihydrolipoamide acetyltransferase family protein [Dactylosporangium sp. CA-233914]|uniref:dihydrolipoamide acetyltransferase family protein n=1 Tax=Dactylosporangium sp. CA-233914 TaxID=3239934 RepID=UPI003D950857